MSAKTSRVMNVTLTPYVPTPKELTFVAVFLVTKETAGPVQVIVQLYISLFHVLKFSQKPIEQYSLFAPNNYLIFSLGLRHR